MDSASATPAASSALCYYTATTGLYTVGSSPFLTTAQSAAGSWQHFVGTLVYPTQAASLYANGVLQQSSTSNFAPTAVPQARL